MEAALTEVCKDIRVGKILIQTSRETGEPELYYLRLPKGNCMKYWKLINMVIKLYHRSYTHIANESIEYDFRYQRL